MNRDWESIVDRIINEARERGEFDPPPAKDKRLTDEHEDVYAGDKAMAYKVMRNSGLAPPFLMKKREIDTKLAEERDRLVRYAKRRRRLHAEADAVVQTEPTLAEALHERAEADWAWAVGKFEEAIPKLNSEIDLFNLMNQIPNLHKARIRLEWEIERAEGQA